MSPEKIDIFYAQNADEWRAWLEKNHAHKQGVWLVFHNKKSEKKSVSWSDSVTEALCFGWIDSKKVKIDAFTSHQYFGKRKEKSTWSKINKEKIEKLTAEGKMTEAGFKSIEIAKENGSWTILDEVENLIIPPDLEAAFAEYAEAKNYFTSLSKSAQKVLLSWIVLAQLPTTRQNRISQIASNAALKQKPKGFL